MSTLDHDIALAERQRLQRRNAVRMALVLAAVAIMVFAGYIIQVARVSG